MKFAILSAVAAGALALSSNTASAQFFGPGYYGGTGVTIARPGGFGITIGSGGVYPSYYGGYGYGGYRPYYGGYSSYYSRPYYGGYSSYARPYYGGYGNYGYRGHHGRRW